MAFQGGYGDSNINFHQQYNFQMPSSSSTPYAVSQQNPQQLIINNNHHQQQQQQQQQQQLQYLHQHPFPNSNFGVQQQNGAVLPHDHIDQRVDTNAATWRATNGMPEQHVPKFPRTDNQQQGYCQNRCDLNDKKLEDLIAMVTFLQTQVEYLKQEKAELQRDHKRLEEKVEALEQEKAELLSQYKYMISLLEKNNEDKVNLPVATRGKRWPEEEVTAFVKLRKEMDPMFNEASTSKSCLWEEISSKMKSLGYERDSKSCKEKWENINKYYHKKKKEGKETRRRSNIAYFEQLDWFYANDEAKPSTSKMDETSKMEESVEDDTFSVIDTTVLPDP